MKTQPMREIDYHHTQTIRSKIINIPSLLIQK